MKLVASAAIGLVAETRPFSEVANQAVRQPKGRRGSSGNGSLYHFLTQTLAITLFRSYSSEKRVR